MSTVPPLIQDPLKKMLISMSGGLVPNYATTVDIVGAEITSIYTHRPKQRTNQGGTNKDPRQTIGGGFAVKRPAVRLHYHAGVHVSRSVGCMTCATPNSGALYSREQSPLGHSTIVNR